MADQSCRIPLSIKVDRDEMYHNFIAPARAENRLNTLIVELLRAYYEVDEVRNIVDQRMLKTDELKVMQAQIDKMIAEHIKTIAQTKALQFESEQAAEGVAVSSDVILKENEAGVQENTPDVIQLLTAITKRLDNLEGRTLNGTMVSNGETENGGGCASGGANTPKTFESAPKTNFSGGGGETTLSNETAEKTAKTGVSETGTGVSDAPPVISGGNSTRRKRKPISFSKVCAGLEKTEA